MALAQWFIASVLLLLTTGSPVRSYFIGIQQFDQFWYKCQIQINFRLDEYLEASIDETEERLANTSSVFFELYTR